MNAFPAYFPLTGRWVAIAGSGEAAQIKARLFDGAPARLVRLAEDETAADPACYAGAALAFIAIADPMLAARAAAAARAAHVPVNVVDRPALCDFYTPAVIDRGEVVAAVGTGGTAPMLAGLLRGDIEARVPAGAGALAALLGSLQGEVRAAFPDLERRRAFLRAAIAGPAAEAAMNGQPDQAEALLRAAMTSAEAAPGAIRIIDGRGPADLLTLRAARVLAEADLLVVDRHADPGVIALARRDAPRLSSSQAEVEQIGRRLAEGAQIVRIAAADPALEAAVLAQAGIVAQVV